MSILKHLFTKVKGFDTFYREEGQKGKLVLVAFL
jgi:hypothetical protein